jgi:general stress protein 26
MMPRLKALILRLLHEHRVMTMATLRPDGWPQATMFGYLNDGFLLYCFVARSTQKFANIQRDPRVSIAIGSDAANPMQVRGLSLAGHASEVSDRSEFDEIAALRLQKFPEYAALPAPLARQDGHLRIAPAPKPTRVALLRIAPDIISVLDYESRLRPQRARHLFGTRSRCASRDPEPPLERGRRHQVTDAPAQCRPNNLSSSQVSRPPRSCCCGRAGAALDCAPVP